MIDYYETNKLKKLYYEVANEDYSSMFSYFLSDDYAYEDNDLRNDPGEYDDLISQFWKECNLMDNKLIRVFSLQLLNHGIDLSLILNLNQTMIVNNK